MIILALLAAGVNAWSASNSAEAVIELKQQWQETESACADAATSCTVEVDTATPYAQISSGRTWGEITWKVEVSVKRDDSGAAHAITVTVPNADLGPSKGDLTAACSAEVAYSTCVTEAWPAVDQSVSSKITLTFAKVAGVACTLKVKVTGTNTGRMVVDDATWSRTLLGKTYNFKGWPNWNVARTECAKLESTTGKEMCLTSEHSDNERDAVSGILATKGFPGGWIGQTEAVGLGKWNDVNTMGWRWSDGSDPSYVAPWQMAGPAGTTYEGLDAVGGEGSSAMARINAITEGRARSSRIIAYAGSEYLVIGHCGAQLVNGEWSGMKCGMRWPAICAPCKAKKITPTNLCHECRLPVDPNKPDASPERCYTLEYCDSFRPTNIPKNPRWEEPFPWMRHQREERIIIYCVICPILMIGYCWWRKLTCFSGFGKDQALEDEE